MASVKKITMREYNGTDYDTLYPKTIAEQVDGIYSKDEILNNGTKALYGLTDNAVPNNVFALIKTLIDNANANANTKAKIVTGSYTGTGTSGESNPNSLTFDFEPKIVAVHDGFINLYYPTTLLWFYGATSMSGQNSTYTKLEISVSGNTFKWVGNSELAQMNISGNLYKYLAIG